MGPGKAAFFASEAAFLFVVFSCPLAFRASNTTIGRLFLPTLTRASHPTVFGIILHAILLAALAYAMLRLGGGGMNTV